MRIVKITAITSSTVTQDAKARRGVRKSLDSFLNQKVRGQRRERRRESR